MHGTINIKKGSIVVLVALIKYTFNLGLLCQIFPSLWMQDFFLCISKKKRKPHFLSNYFPFSTQIFFLNLSVVNAFHVTFSSNKTDVNLASLNPNQHSHFEI